MFGAVVRDADAAGFSLVEQSFQSLPPFLETYAVNVTTTPQDVKHARDDIGTCFYYFSKIRMCRNATKAT